VFYGYLIEIVIKEYTSVDCVWLYAYVKVRVSPLSICPVSICPHTAQSITGYSVEHHSQCDNADVIC